MSLSKENISYQRKNNADGTTNAKYIDLLEEDKPISGQKYTCISFVSPENILKQRELFFFENFLKEWDFTKSMEKYSQFLNFLSFKYNMNFDDLMVDLHDFVKEEKSNLIKTSIEDEYKNYMDQNEERLENEFNIQHDFKTSTRGIKVRGSYSTSEEAELRCRLLREVDPNHNIYVGPVGQWMPWEPGAYKTGRVEYMEDELNQLMHEKQKNEGLAKQEFEKRIKETKHKAIAENKKLAQESGNKLSQNITDTGDLVSVTNTNTTENRLLENSSEVSVGDIRKELFEGEDVIMEKETDHGLSELTENKTKDLINQEGIRFEVYDKNTANTETTEGVETTEITTCEHEWVIGPEQGIDEHREKICKKCNLTI